MMGMDSATMMGTARWLVAGVGGSTAVGATLVDYFILGKQHMRNPRWRPHAKFHNGQSIVMGTFQGVLALAIVFGLPLTPTSLTVGALVSGSYWVAAFGAILFPGTAWTDPEFEAETPMPLGFHIQQLLGGALLTLLAISIGLALLPGTMSVTSKARLATTWQNRQRVPANEGITGQLSWRGGLANRR